jgi:hypothetical protein
MFVIPVSQKPTSKDGGTTRTTTVVHTIAKQPMMVVHVAITTTNDIHDDRMMER